MTTDYAKWLACPDCGKRFSTKTTFIHHRQSGHCPNVIELSCGKCGRTFPTTRGMRVHQAHCGTTATRQWNGRRGPKEGA